MIEFWSRIIEGFGFVLGAFIALALILALIALVVYFIFRKRKDKTNYSVYRMALNSKPSKKELKKWSQ
jgi:cbb3-type cytochrome oxidase subunit 3